MKDKILDMTLGDLFKLVDKHRQETDNQIAKRKWSDFWDEVIDESNWDTDCPCTYVPEWLDKEEE